MNDGLDDPDQSLEALLYGMAGNALLVMFAGVAAMIVWNRAKRTLHTNASETGGLGTDMSFFHTMSPSMLHGYVHRTRFDPPTARGILYLFAFMIPGLGSLAGVLFMMSDKPGYQTTGTSATKISIASLSIFAALTSLLCLVVMAAN